MGLIGFQCIVGQWRFDLQTFRLAATAPIRIKSVSRGSTVSNSEVILDANSLVMLHLFSAVILLRQREHSSHIFQNNIPTNFQYKLIYNYQKPVSYTHLTLPTKA